MTTAGADIEAVYNAHRTPALQAVLFDLDDTLFDHQAAARAALQVVQAQFECFRRLTPDDFERTHAGFLERLHHRVVSGEVGIDEARIERFRLLLEAAGEAEDSERAAVAARRYRHAYVEARRPIAGAAALLQALRARVRIGIVTNNLLEEQQQKLRHCGLETCVTHLIVSEEARVSKPDPAIFRIALARLGCEPAEAVMVGDSWPNDVRGARAAGIPAVWFNRRGEMCPEPGAGVPELRALEPTDAAVRIILHAHPSTRRAHRD
ncbi:MAG TPA: HAD family hydrolase [Vicinamibacterales bacterium]|nr:HAD family hydrolase [Vicinamibacterales bacterium]